MVLVEFTDPETKKTYKYYLNIKLRKALDKIKKKITKRDMDYLIIVDGEEGSGKSTLAMQLAKYVDPTFCIDRIAMNGQEFIKIIHETEKKKAVVFDEAFSGLSSRSSLSELNNLINSLIMEMRQRNLFVVIVLPSVFVLDKYVAMFRSRCLFHTYFKNGNRGNFAVYNRKKKNALIIKGKKFFSYAGVRTAFRGRFTSKYVIDEEAYRQKKLDAFRNRQTNPKQDRYLDQRNKLLKLFREKTGMSYNLIEKEFKKAKIPLGHTQIHEIVTEKPIRP